METERLGPFRSRLCVAGNNFASSLSEYTSQSRLGVWGAVSRRLGAGGRGRQTGFEVV
jgi:hypothetical protein